MAKNFRSTGKRGQYYNMLDNEIATRLIIDEEDIIVEEQLAVL